MAYFNCAYLSPLLRSVREAGQWGIDQKLSPWKVTPEDFFTDSEEARRLFGQLIEAPPSDIALIPSASYGLAVAARNLPLQAGDQILLLEEQFPSNVYIWQQLARTSGAEILTVPRPSDGNWTAAILASLSPRVALATLPQCHWADGSFVDLARLAPEIRAVGAQLVLDLSQSLGAMPFSIPEIQPDFMVSVAYKWLLGPYGSAILYVAPKHQEGSPLEETWMGRRDSEDFAALVNYREDYQEGALRFDMGERSNFILLPMVIAALRQILQWTPATIAAELRSRCDHIAHEAAALGYKTIPREHRGPHFLGLGLPDQAPIDLAGRLKESNIFVSQRGRSLRLAPHLYNDEEDLRKLVEGLGKLAFT